MLGTGKLVAFTATTQPAEARAFYERVLGLTLLEDSPFALVFDANGTTLRVQKVDAHRPQPFTALGFQVADVSATLAGLAQRGIAPKRFDFLDQDASGIWKAPGGTAIAWFEDPDGNLLSISNG